MLASELVARSSGATDLPETAPLRLAVEVGDDALRVDVRHPGGSSVWCRRAGLALGKR